MPKFTKEQQAIILHDAARAANMDGHVSTNKPYTMAEKAMAAFGGKPRGPRKNSYLYLDTVDACFFFQEDERPAVAFTAVWNNGAKDIDKLADAAPLIKAMLQNMTDMAAAAAAGTEAESGEGSNAL